MVPSRGIRCGYLALAEHPNHAKGCQYWAGLGDLVQALHHRIVDIKIGINVLYVVVVFESIHDAQN